MTPNTEHDDDAIDQLLASAQRVREHGEVQAASEGMTIDL